MNTSASVIIMCDAIVKCNDFYENLEDKWFFYIVQTFKR